MNEREALIRIRDNAQTISEAVQIAREALQPPDPTDLEIPVPSTTPGYTGDETSPNGDR